MEFTEDETSVTGTGPLYEPYHIYSHLSELQSILATSAAVHIGYPISSMQHIKEPILTYWNYDISGDV